jgi:hypothetical protein
MRNEYDFIVSTSSLSNMEYAPIGLITLETEPSIHLLGFIPPDDLEDEMRKLETEVREDLILEGMEMGGNAIINLKYEKRIGGFTFIIPFYTTITLVVTGEVVRIKKNRKSTLKKAAVLSVGPKEKKKKKKKK